ncbi:GNAT family N-acetyltransferase [Anaerolineales bacterium HSG6]|nr:GNAT family N-acetyltransferase [Anaerolineales bacterium HSG6]
MSIFDGNCPKFFNENERPALVNFLDNPPCPYFVLPNEHDEIIGCGGYSISKDGERAGFMWGMIRHDLHGQGLGRFLLEARIEAIKTHGTVKQIIMDTSQHTVGFYKQFGFEVQKVTPDGYGAGLSQYDLVLTLEETPLLIKLQNRLQADIQAVETMAIDKAKAHLAAEYQKRVLASFRAVQANLLKLAEQKLQPADLRQQLKQLAQQLEQRSESEIRSQVEKFEVGRTMLGSLSGTVDEQIVNNAEGLGYQRAARMIRAVLDEPCE